MKKNVKPGGIYNKPVLCKIVLDANCSPLSRWEILPKGFLIMINAIYYGTPQLISTIK